MNKALVAALVVPAGSIALLAQLKTNVPDVVPGARPAVVERITIHGQALESNLEGNAVDRDAIVFLPPSYNSNQARRYPVVYALHGYSIGADQWTREIHVPQTIEGAFAKGAHEMIVVLPDSKTVHNGSMYSTSVTTGDFENYVARDVVAYIDAHYRTNATRESRGLVGHSMGGYGAARIGMKHADVFGSLYIIARAVCPRAAAAVAALHRRTAPRTTSRSQPSRRRLTRRNCRSPCARNSRRPQRGRPIRRTRRSISISRSATTSSQSSRSGPPMRRSPSSINTFPACGAIARSRSTSAIRTDCASMPGSCTTCSISTASRTRSRSTRGRTRATSPSAFRST